MMLQGDSQAYYERQEREHELMGSDQKNEHESLDRALVYNYKPRIN